MGKKKYIVRYKSDGDTCGVMVNAASPETAKDLVRQEHQRSFRMGGAEEVPDGAKGYGVLVKDRRNGTLRKLVVAATDENEAQRKAFVELGVDVVPCACQTCDGIVSPEATILGIVELTDEQALVRPDGETLGEAK